MAEAVGTALAVVGFLGQMFDGCVKAYGYFSTATQMDGDSARLMCKVRIEEMRLVVWGREWGVSEGKLEAHLDDASGGGGNPRLRALAVQILEELHATVTDFKRLQEKYGLADAASTPPEEGNGKLPAKGGLATLSKSKLNVVDAKATITTGTEKSWKRELSLRTKWVIRDKEKFQNLLRDLKDFNDGLENLFPPSQLPSLQRAWTNRLLESAQRDIQQLSLLESASSDTYPQLTTSANLKKLRINLDSKPASSFKPTFALKVARSSLDLSSHPAACSRCVGQHEVEGSVVVEWIQYDKEALDERLAHMKRLDDLARMMHSASSAHPDLHSIDCVGYTDDSASSRYGLVYRAPGPSFNTLHSLMASSDLKTPDLDQRVKLARTLAVSLWSLHSLDWLHKSLCASNVLFFSAASAAALGSTATAALVPDISKPFLCGFDASRPDLDVALSVVPKNPSILDLHRHPDSRRGAYPYCKAFDVYSLGLVLLEIGLWKVLQTYHKPTYTAEKWRDRVVLAVLVPGLGSKVGRRYRDIVEKCLKVTAEMTSSEAGKIMEEVVAGLENIRV